MSQFSTLQEAERPSQTIEDYLMAMYLMERDFEEIVAARLAEMFKVTPATVATTIKRMERDHWVDTEGRGNVTLTEAGRQAARSVIRRHLLVECMLVEMLDVPMADTHREAHGIEHAISPELEERIRIKLGDPKLCPHGNPFPGYETLTEGWVPLTDLDSGEKIIIRRIHSFAEQGHAMVEFLYAKGIKPGVEAKVVEKLTFNQTIGLRINNRAATLGFLVARFIFVEKV